MLKFQKITQRAHASGGFTLIELLVVISIIGVLAAVLLTNFVGVRSRANDARKKADLRQVKTALRLYYNDYQQYPGMVNGLVFEGCGAAGTTACTRGGEFSAGSSPTVYMKELPYDLRYYAADTGGDDFLLMMTLENAGDEEIVESQNRCDPTSRSYYSGTPSAQDYFLCED